MLSRGVLVFMSADGSHIHMRKVIKVENTRLSPISSQELKIPHALCLSGLLPICSSYILGETSK